MCCVDSSAEVPSEPVTQQLASLDTGERGTCRQAADREIILRWTSGAKSKAQWTAGGLLKTTVRVANYRIRQLSGVRLLCFGFVEVFLSFVVGLNRLPTIYYSSHLSMESKSVCPRGGFA